MNALDEVIDQAALNFHRSAWPLHTGLRSLRALSPRWFVPRVGRLGRSERRIVSGAMGLLRCSVAPLVVGAAIRIAASFAPFPDRALLACSGVAVADVGLVLMTLALGLVLAVRIKRAIAER